MSGETCKRRGPPNRATPAQDRGQRDDGSLPNEGSLEQNRPFQRSSQPMSQSSSGGTGLAGFAAKIQREKQEKRQSQHRQHQSDQQDAVTKQQTHQQEAIAVKKQRDEVSYGRGAEDRHKGKAKACRKIILLSTIIYDHSLKSERVRELC